MTRVCVFVCICSLKRKRIFLPEHITCSLIKPLIRLRHWHDSDNNDNALRPLKFIYQRYISDFRDPKLIKLFTLGTVQQMSSTHFSSTCISPYKHIRLCMAHIVCWNPLLPIKPTRHLWTFPWLSLISMLIK